MAPIRVLLAEMPQMLHDIVTDLLAAQPDMVVTGPPPADDRDLSSAVERARADAVVVASGPERSHADAYRSLLVAHPRVKVVALAADGRRASLHEMRPVTVALGEVSAVGLVEAIRAAVRGGAP